MRGERSGMENLGRFFKTGAEMEDRIQKGRRMKKKKKDMEKKFRAWLGLVDPQCCWLLLEWDGMGWDGMLCIE